MVAITYECPNCHQHSSHADKCPSYYEQPIPDIDGEWRVDHFTKGGANEWMVVTKTGRCVALANINDPRVAEAEMRQIVADHKVAKTQALLVDALLAAKKHIGRNPQSPALMPQIDAALKAAGVTE
jgi:hypothetical protein